MHDPQPRLWHHILRPVATSAFGAFFFLRIATPLDRLLVRLTKGRFTLTFGYPTLVLITRGAKSGLVRENPLLFIPEGNQMLIVASNTGSEKHPGWYYNLRANPVAEVIAYGHRTAVQAIELTGSERDALWPRIEAVYPGYRDYKRLAGARQIPVLRLVPQRAPSSG